MAVETTSDIAAAVSFARQNELRLGIRGTGHDYLGRSRGSRSLLLWTHAMRDIEVHEAFVPYGAVTEGNDAAVPAVTVGAGTHWLEVYQALALYGRFVVGGGCTSVGAAGGFVLGGGFSSFTKDYGSAAGNVLEFEVVTADGGTLVANEQQHPLLFWALRGGGGGTFGVVSKVTYRTYPMPRTITGAAGSIRASTDTDYRALIRRVVRLFPDLIDLHWGETIRFGPDNSIELGMAAVDLDDEAAGAVWRPLLDWVARRPEAYSSDAYVASGPFTRFWDAERWDEVAPQMIRHDDRPGRSRHFWWEANDDEVSWYVDAFASRWIPAGLFAESPDRLADVFFGMSRRWFFHTHANKGLAGASEELLQRERVTSLNPSAFEAAALLIIGSTQPRAFPGVPEHEPDRQAAGARARRVSEAMDLLRAITPGSGSYVNQADYFEDEWQHSFWGANYPKLLEAKATYDPDNVFRVHHGVGSERTN